MAYKRKTADEHAIQQRSCSGWEDVTTETTARDARRALREYRENQPEYPARYVKRRVRLA